MQYVAFLDTMARAMRIDQIGHDVEFGLSADALVVRAEQLAKSEVRSVHLNLFVSYRSAFGGFHHFNEHGCKSCTHGIVIG